jgi:hypothetical protein
VQIKDFYWELRKSHIYFTRHVEKFCGRLAIRNILWNVVVFINRTDAINAQLYSRQYFITLRKLRVHQEETDLVHDLAKPSADKMHYVCMYMTGISFTERIKSPYIEYFSKF